MKRILLASTLLIALGSVIHAQDKPAYQLYDTTGNVVPYESMIKDLASGDMVFLGEYHGNPIAHWMQREITKSLYAERGPDLYLGAEMFECGNQLVINEYLQDFYPEKKMLPELTQLWNNYKTDYKPLLDFAKENKLRFIATNIPRRYASMISKKGMGILKELSPDALAMISPDLEKYYDPNTKALTNMSEMMGGHMPNMEYMLISQASKDATMAHFSVKNFNSGDLLIHYQGAFHSNYHDGILWWINQIKPGLNMKTVTTVLQSEWAEMSEEDKSTIADYIIVIADGIK